MTSIRALYGGEVTDDARAALSRLQGRSLPPVVATSRLTVCPSAGKPCDPSVLPPHAVCSTSTNPDGLCWCWSGCDDPECDHPACSMAGWARFRDAFNDAHSDAQDSVVVWASPWLPWLERGRHKELLAEFHAGELRATKPPPLERLLRLLEKGPVRPCLALGAEYLYVEVQAVASGVVLESRETATSTRDHLAYLAASGGSLEDAGGLMTSEIRLAAAVDLAAAPVGFQGSLW